MVSLTKKARKGDWGNMDGAAVREEFEQFGKIESILLSPTAAVISFEQQKSVSEVLAKCLSGDPTGKPLTFLGRAKDRYRVKVPVAPWVLGPSSSALAEETCWRIYREFAASMTLQDEATGAEPNHEDPLSVVGCTRIALDLLGPNKPTASDLQTSLSQIAGGGGVDFCAFLEVYSKYKDKGEMSSAVVDGCKRGKDIKSGGVFGGWIKFASKAGDKSASPEKKNETHNSGTSMARELPPCELGLYTVSSGSRAAMAHENSGCGLASKGDIGLMPRDGEDAPKNETASLIHFSNSHVPGGISGLAGFPTQETYVDDGERSPGVQTFVEQVPSCPPSRPGSSSRCALCAKFDARSSISSALEENGTRSCFWNQGGTCI